MGKYARNIDEAKIREAVRLLIEGLGEDPCREGLRDTPCRVARMWREFLVPEPFISSTFEVQYDQMVVVKNIPFVSFCEHHLLPFVGVAHIGYIPKERVIGLSKLARILVSYSRKLQIQERLTSEVADEILSQTKGTGVGVVIRARHFCMTARGVKAPGAEAVTSALRGDFLASDVKAEFFAIINQGGEV
jgi:GTP cyclohydrolase I